MKNTMKERQYCVHNSAGCGDALKATPLPVTVINVPSVEPENWLKRALKRLTGREGSAALNALSDAQLQDIGLSRENLDKEHSHRGWPNWPK